MAPRSILNLILKVIGVFFIRDILEALSHTLSAIIYIPEYSSGREAFFNVAVTLPPLILYCLLAWILIFRSEKIISILRLEKNLHDKPVTITIERNTLLGIAIIISGVWILVNEIPELFRHAMYYYQERKLYVRMTRPDVSYLVMSAIKIIIALLLIVFNKSIVKIIEWGGKNRLLWRKKAADGRREKAEMPG